MFLANSVDDEDTLIEIYKGADEITIDDCEWSESLDIVTITTASNLSKGTYTVILSSIEDEEDADEADFEVTGRYVNEIVIDTEEALTDPDDKTIAYAHYDVYDQYGESMRTSASITWAGSATITADKTTGKLKLEKTSANDWVYGEKIYVTGVYAKTGISTQKTLSVGQGQALNSLEVAGFVKKGTDEIVQTLPADFKAGTYYILFNGLDQQGTPIKVGTIQANDVTFVSDSPLVIESIVTPLKNGGLTVKGTEYEAAFVKPGIKVSDGGAVIITAIANKTGNKTEIPVLVGEDQVVASFTLSSPTVTVADGDTGVEIPFTALDQNGDEITDFVTLAKQETFNTISFQASEGDLKLAEQDNGTAKLVWSDDAAFQGVAGWTQPRATDGQTRPISLTVVVVGGGTDNEMFDVEDKRRPNAILAADIAEVYTEGDTITLSAAGNGAADSFKSFQFIDQYDQIIEGTDDDKVYGDSTGFFRANSANFVDQELKNYTFGVRLTYTGANAIVYNTGVNNTTVIDDIADGVFSKQAVLLYNGTITFDTAQNIASASTGEGFKFEIVKTDSAANIGDGKSGDWDTVSPTRYVETTVVDLSQVKSFAISDLNKFYVGASATFTGEGQIAATKLGDTAGSLGNDDKTAFGAATGGLSQVPVDPTNPTAAETQAAKYQQTVKVKGTYNGISVTIPAKFYKVVGSKVTTAETLGANKVNATVDTATGLTIQDLYDRTSAKGVAKEATDTLKVTLYNIYGGATNGTNTTAISYYDMKATTAAASAALIDADTAAGAAKAVTLVTIPAGTMTQTQVIAAITTANGHLDDVVTADASAHTTATAEITAMKTNTATITTDGFVVVYDTTSKDITISDQKPVATKISGLKDSYTLNPDNTKITNAVIVAKVVTEPGVKVKDQYGVEIAEDITYRATEIVESEDGYAAHNFAVAGNDSTTMEVTKGAERGDTFTLLLKAGGAEASTAVTVGADAEAYIDEAGNKWIPLRNNYLEPQRLAGLS